MTARVTECSRIVSSQEADNFMAKSSLRTWELQSRTSLSWYKIVFKRMSIVCGLKSSRERKLLLFISAIDAPAADSIQAPRRHLTHIIAANMILQE